MSRKLVGAVVCWYRREDWDKFKVLADDHAMFSGTYDDWLRRAEKAVETVKRSGMSPIRFTINPDDLKTWCASKGLKINSKARNSFAVERTNEAIRKRSAKN
jgi:hypothetical protein